MPTSAARASAETTSDPSPEPPAKRKKRAHVKMELEPAATKAKREPASPKPRSRRASTAATPEGKISGKVVASFSPPDNWPEVLGLIKKMREVGGAPVDTMGCEKISEDVAPDAKGRRFVTLVSAMLSSQTKDPITHAATARLVAHGCTPENIAATSEETLDELITPVGFHSRKAASADPRIGALEAPSKRASVRRGVSRSTIWLQTCLWRRSRGDDGGRLQPRPRGERRGLAHALEPRETRG